MTTEHRRAQWRRYSQSEKGKMRRKAYREKNIAKIQARRNEWSRENWPDIKVARNLGISLEQARKIKKAPTFEGSGPSRHAGVSEDSRQRIRR